MHTGPTRPPSPKLQQTETTAFLCRVNMHSVNMSNCFSVQFHKQLKQLVKRGATHPKMAALLEVVLHHFQPHGAPPQPNGAPSQPHGAPPQPHGAPPTA